MTEQYCVAERTFSGREKPLASGTPIALTLGMSVTRTPPPGFVSVAYPNWSNGRPIYLGTTTPDPAWTRLTQDVMTRGSSGSSPTPRTSGWEYANGQMVRVGRTDMPNGWSIDVESINKTKDMSRYIDEVAPDGRILRSPAPQLNIRVRVDDNAANTRTPLKESVYLSQERDTGVFKGFADLADGSRAQVSVTLDPNGTPQSMTATRLNESTPVLSL